MPSLNVLQMNEMSYHSHYQLWCFFTR